MAWRETEAPSVRLEIEAGPPSESRPTIRSRVGSPSAANTGALSASRASADRRALMDSRRRTSR
jgi:hypothetical protein